jgi:hypothetical protein
MMDWRARSNAIAVGRELSSRRHELAEYHGRTIEEAYELRSKAAKSAAICGECFRPLAPTDSVTMEFRKIGGSRRANNECWARVPVCLLCTLDAIELWRVPGGDAYYSEPHWERARCLNCGRPLRLRRPEHHRRWFNSFGIRLPWTPSLNAQVCCDACQRLALNKRNALRRGVQHEPITCIECGRPFIPKRAAAVTCSNRCRQAQHRQRQHSDAGGGVNYPLRPREQKAAEKLSSIEPKLDKNRRKL